jgi:glyoxylase-like metal-dependent hydrolase (beta-lactamase superfamily II)
MRSSTSPISPTPLPPRAARWAHPRALLIAAAAIACASATADAGAPLAKGQAPGWYRVTVGDFEVTALSDGTIDLPVDTLLTNTTPDKVKRALAAAYLKPPVEASVNAYLVNTGTKLVMIDAGTGALFGPTLGRLVSNLRASGYRPEQVDEIYITHMHGDHIGGLMTGNQRTFPNAVVRAGKAEGEHWLSQANMDKAPEATKGFFKAAMATVGPYVTAGKYKPIDADGELVPGVRAQSTSGHTPGHMIYWIESKGERMAFWGDLMHVAAVQFPDPSVTIQFDSDSKAAAPQRKKAFADAAAKGYLVGVAHISFPGIGRLRAERAGYAWVPINYSTK